MAPQAGIGFYSNLLSIGNKLGGMTSYLNPPSTSSHIGKTSKFARQKVFSQNEHLGTASMTGARILVNSNQNGCNAIRFCI
eukprot:1711535-Amphidinium_carterae.1